MNSGVSKAKPRGKPFAKGKSGNPGGLPKGYIPLRPLLLEIGQETDPATRRSRLEALARRLWDAAERPDATHHDIDRLLDRLVGKPTTHFQDDTPERPLEGVPDEKLIRIAESE